MRRQREVTNMFSTNILFNRTVGLLCLLAILTVCATAHSGEEEYILVTGKGRVIEARDGRTGKTLFKHEDPLQTLDWAMMNSRITVLGGCEYIITNSIPIPRPNIALIIDKDAAIRLDPDLIPQIRPAKPLAPAIYNGGHDNVTVINLGSLTVNVRRAGRGVFFDGRSEGSHGIDGGRIIDAGLSGTPGAAGTLCGRRFASLADCANVEVPLLFGDGYQVNQLRAEGCKDLKIGTVVATSRPSKRPVTLNGMNYGTSIDRIIAATTMGQAGVLVKSSPGTKLNEAHLFGIPTESLKIIHCHEYGPSRGGTRFTLRPHIEVSEGTKALKSSISHKQIKSWPQSLELVDFPDSLPNLKIKFKLSAICTCNTEEVVVDETFDFTLLDPEKYTEAPEPVFVYSGKDSVYAKGLKTGERLYEGKYAGDVIEWSMAKSPITVLQEGVLTVTQEVVVPRADVSLIVNENAELRQDPDIIPATMPGGRGGYRTLLHNPGHDNVKVFNFGTMRAYNQKRGVAIHFDGRNDGEIGIDGGLIFSSGLMCADDVTWVVDAKNIRIPLMIGRGYGNSPLAFEGVEDSEIGILAALMGCQAFENEALDFNSYCKRVRVGLVIATTPAEEILDINNSPNCIFEDVRVYRSHGDVAPLRVDDWPEWKQDYRNMLTEMPWAYHSRGSSCENSRIVEKKVAQWIKSVDITPLEKTLPGLELKLRLEAVYKDGTRELLYDEPYKLDNVLLKD